MSVKRLTLDTNILIYAVDKDAGQKHEKARDIIDQAIYLDTVLTLQVLCEFYSATTRKGYAKPKEVITFIDGWMDVFPIVESRSTTLVMALKGIEKYKLSFWDAMLWATAREAQCSFLLSEDFQDNVKLGGVYIANPLTLEKPLEELLKESK